MNPPVMQNSVYPHCHWLQGCHGNMVSRINYIRATCHRTAGKREGWGWHRVGERERRRSRDKDWQCRSACDWENLGTRETEKSWKNKTGVMLCCGTKRGGGKKTDEIERWVEECNEDVGTGVNGGRKKDDDGYMSRWNCNNLPGEIKSYSIIIYIWHQWHRSQNMPSTHRGSLKARLLPPPDINMCIVFT